MLEMRTESIDQNISNNIGQGERGENFHKLHKLDGIRVGRIRTKFKLGSRFVKLKILNFENRLSSSNFEF